MKIKLNAAAREIQRQWCRKGGLSGSKADKSRAGKLGHAAMIRNLIEQTKNQKPAKAL